MNAFKLALFLTLICCSFSLMADPETGTGEPAVQVEAAENATEESSVPETLPPEDQAQGIMDSPLDGSSVEAFSAGLLVVDEEATEKEYRTLMSALDFLLFYDVGARRNKERLYSRLNGKSPNEIIRVVASYRKDRKK